MQRGDNLDALTISAQKEADDASADHNYVGQVGMLTHIAEDGGVIASCDDGGEMPDRRVEMLKFAAVQAVCLRRANGAVGRGMIRFRWADEGLEAQWGFVKSPIAVFDWYRKVA